MTISYDEFEKVDLRSGTIIRAESFARAKNIITTTSGSAAGSLVSYAVGITTADPMSFDLPFERFLNPYRPSPPDIDIDIE